MDPVARALGIVGVVLALASLTTTILLWYRSGSILKVTARIPTGGTSIQVQLVNVGRVGATVRRIELRDHFVAYASGAAIQQCRWAMPATNTLPASLPPGEILDTDFDISTVLAKTDGAPNITVIAAAERGDGKWYLSTPLQLR